MRAALALALLAALESFDARRTRAFDALWHARYAEARAMFRTLVSERPRDAASRLGLAQADYWSGDFRRAAREFEDVLRIDPGNRDARRAREEIRSASQPGYVVDGGLLDDDQPYRAAGSQMRAYGFRDPLTKWEAGLLVGYPARSATLANETVVPAIRTTFRTALTAMRFPDGTNRLLPAAGAESRIGSKLRLDVSLRRQELVRSAAALHNHPTADIASIRFFSSSFAVHAEQLRYFDHNRGFAADAYALRPVTSTLSLGASAAWRDTDQSRFDGSRYDPYYTPQRQSEARLIAAAAWTRGNRTFGLHLDGGAAHDAVSGDFRPWRAAATATFHLPRGETVTIAAEHNATAFYRSNEIRASMAGRF